MMSQENQLLTTDICYLFQIFNNHLRLVGGCVRDFLLKRPVHDFDLATPLKPADVIALLKENQVPFFETGLKHGTITVVLNHQNYEITSLRADYKTDGRHAEVQFGVSYEEDAKRRDFTINALYMDEKGKIYDYVKSFQDIQDCKVRFIGSATERISEDYLRILRYFRFLSVLTMQEIDEEALTACETLKEGLKKISRERIREEFFKILLGKNVISTLELMQRTGVLQLFIGKANIEQLAHFVFFYPKAGALERLSILCDGENVPDWKWSRIQKKELSGFQKKCALPQNVRTAQRLLWQLGKKCFLFHLECFRMRGRLSMSHYYAFKKLTLPKFPIKGCDFYRLGYRGAQIGTLMKKAQQKWIEMNFPLKKSLVIKNVLSYNKKYPNCHRRKK